MYEQELSWKQKKELIRCSLTIFVMVAVMISVVYWGICFVLDTRDTGDIVEEVSSKSVVPAGSNVSREPFDQSKFDVVRADIGDVNPRVYAFALNLLVERGEPREGIQPKVMEFAETSRRVEDRNEIVEAVGCNWNLMDTVGAFELTDLFILDDTFVIGLYKCRDTDRILEARMATRATYAELRAGLLYHHVTMTNFYTDYKAFENMLVGSAFAVRQFNSHEHAFYTVILESGFYPGEVAPFMYSLMDGGLTRSYFNEEIENEMNPWESAALEAERMRQLEMSSEDDDDTAEDED